MSTFVVAARQSKRDDTTYRFAHSRSSKINATASDFALCSAPIIYRKASCACGGGCPDCRSKPAIQTKLSISQPGDIYEQEADRMADQVMRMPDPASARSSIDSTPIRALSIQRQCAACEDEDEDGEKGLQRKPNSFLTETPSSGRDPVTATLRQGGQPLDANTRSFFEPRFGTDFSAVRIHTDTQAAESARSVNALAYTVGHNVVFSSGQYAPQSDSGKRLLAHELTHVVQQGGSSDDSMIAKVLQRTPNPIDSQAQALITLAQDTTIPIDQRAQRLVTQILTTYYLADASKFTQVNWVETDPGVTAVCAQSGPPTMTCTINVGRYFVENTTSAGISRRVLQIGHEIQHVNQHRQGMGGAVRRHEREFLAFHWEATATEAAGTGRMAHATRVAVIDAAIKNYNCLTATEKTTYNTQYQQLVTLRQTEQAASGNPATPAPTQCGG